MIFVEDEAKKRDVDPQAPKRKTGKVGATLIWIGQGRWRLIRVLNILADGRVRFTSRRRVCR